MKFNSTFLLVASLFGACAFGCAETVRSFSTTEDASSPDDDGEQKGDSGKPSGAGGSGGADTDAAPIKPGDPDASEMDSSIPGTGGSGTDPDSGAPALCEKAFDCDDGIDCTVDTCTKTGCTNVVDDKLCAQVAGGVCDAKNGCQYPVCNSDTCSAGSCQTARCEGDVCVRESMCLRGEMCCAGQCAPAGCDDGLDCTSDQCGLRGCEHSPMDSACNDGNECTDERCEVGKGCVPSNNASRCDDGVFCNGPDTCSAGTCSTHPGDPCPGQSRCEEATDVCAGCVTDNDCPDEVVGAWGSCDFGGSACAEAGTQKRSVTSYSCDAGSCKAKVAEESQACARDTDGFTCAGTVLGAYGACQFPATCATNGSQSRKRTDYKCASGTCADVTSTEQASCTRVTQGSSCGTCQTCGGNGTCNTMPVDDAACGVIDCPSDTSCTDYQADLTSARCQALGQCKTPGSCAAKQQDKGVACDLCATCDGAGKCNVMPADDAKCGEIACPASTACAKYPTSITDNRCESLLMCIDASACEAEFAKPGTDCSEFKAVVQQCNGQGKCGDPLVDCGRGQCLAGSCCYDGNLGVSCNPRGGCIETNTIGCDEKADCPGTQICCARSYTLPGEFGSSCTAPAECVAAKGLAVAALCGAGGCPPGYACIGTFGGYESCKQLVVPVLGGN